MDAEWRMDKCTFLGLPFHCSNGLSTGGPNVALTCPHVIRSIQGDGNCLFRCFSYLITGSEEHHMAVRSAFIDHMPNIESVFGGNAQQYITDTGMDRSGTWGNTEEVLGLSHLLNTPVYSYVPSTYNWTRLSPDVVDLTQHSPITQKSIYIQNQHMHFTVIVSALPYNTQ